MSRQSEKIYPMQAGFVRQYLIDFVGVLAAIRAGYSERSAEATASRLLSLDKIQCAIAKGQERQIKRTEITADMVVREYAKIAFADMSTYATWGEDGIKLTRSEDLPEGASAVVVEVSETKTRDGGTVRFKLADKQHALDQLGKHLGMFVERHEFTGKDGAPIEIDQEVKVDHSKLSDADLDILLSVAGRLESSTNGGPPQLPGVVAGEGTP